MNRVFSVLLCATLAVTTFLGRGAEVPNTLLHTINAPPVGTQAGALFGHCVAVDGGYAVVGIPSDDTGAYETGVVKVFDSSTGALLWILRNPAQTPENDNFGSAVAISGARAAVIGAYSVYVFDLTSATPDVPVVTLNHAAPSSGSSVAISGTRIVVGVPNSPGKAFVFELTSATPTVPATVLNNPTGVAGDEFGRAVAISGTRVVVGDPKKETGASNTGRAYVFDLASGTPTVPVATLNNPAPNPEDKFGSALALSGTRLVVAEELPVGTAGNAWTAYVYDLSGGTPTVPVVTLPDPQTTTSTTSYLGHNHTRVGISGTRVLLGAYGSDAGANDAGIAVVYDLASASPTVPVMTLNNPAPAPSDQFGYSVAIVGTKVVVSAPYDDTVGFETGSVYLYELSGAIPPAPVSVANDPGPLGEDHFGSSVAVSGTRALVGSPDDDTGAPNAGSAYVYDLSSDRPTVPVVTLQNPTPVTSEQFGTPVAIAGLYAAVGCCTDDAEAGTVYVYDLGSATPTAPAITLKQPGGPDKTWSFGSVIALSGSLLVVGGDTTNTTVSHEEKVYVYDVASATPAVPVATLNNPFPLNGDEFGTSVGSVGISGTRVVVGAPGDDMGATNAGSVYIFDLNSATPAVPVAALENPMLPEVLGFGSKVAISGARVAVVGSAGFGQTVFVYDLSSPTPTTPTATLVPGVYVFSLAISGTVVAVGDRDANAVGAGRTFLYDVASQTPTVPVTTLENPSPAHADYFGSSVAIDGSIIAIGAPYDDTTMADKGSVYVYGPAGPEIVVQAEAGPATLPDGGSQSVGDVFVNGASTVHFTIKNIGSVPLTGLATTIDGSNAADFTIISSPVAPVSGPSGSTSLTVKFSPGSLGVRTATLHIASNDTDESPFDITLTGTGIEQVNRVVDQGSPVTFLVEVPPGATVQWRKDGVDIPDAVGSTLSFGSAQPWQIGVYSARVTTAAGSSVRDVAVLGLTGVPSGPWRGLVSWYRFDSSAEDMCRPGKPAGLINTSDLAADPQRGRVAQIRGKGWAVPPFPGEPPELQGPGGYLQIPRPPLVDGEPFTVSFVIKEEGFSLWHGESLFTMGEGASSNDLLTHFWVGSMQGAQEIYAGPSQTYQPYASDYVLDDALGAAISVTSPWTAYTGVGDGTIVRFYRNGQLMGSSPYKKETLGDSFIGRHWWENGANYSTRLIAKVDDIRIYNRALSEPEIEQLYSSVQNTPPAGSFESWALIHGLTGTDTSPSADPDQDDLTNQDEFHLGTSPTDGTQLPFTATLTGTTLRLEWLEKTGVLYSLKETSDFLNPWPTSATVPVPSADQSGVPAGYQRVHADLPVPPSGTPAAPRFFRVEATKAP